MSAIINGDSPSVTFSDGTTQATSAIVSGKVPYTNLPAGSVLQVVNATTSTETSNTTSTFVDTNLTATITPKFATSKILVIVHQASLEKASNNTGLVLKLLRGSTTLINIEAWAAGTNDTSLNVVGGSGCNYLDSPATTSATTYKTQFCSHENNNIVYCQYGNSPYASTSTITLMEIAA